MAGKYSEFLATSHDRVFITDGGLETTLIFQDGLELPEFASFVALTHPAGRAAVRQYYEPYAASAQRNGWPCLFNTATWRTNAAWGAKLGYSEQELAALNRDAVKLLLEARAAWEPWAQPVLINGAIGPRLDGYVFEADTAMDVESAAAFHAPQVQTLAFSGVDVVTAWTMNYASEAAGIALAASRAGVPCIISFTVETDGTLPDGSSLAAAISATDAAAAGSPLFYMVNCAYVTHVERALLGAGVWRGRLGGVRANPSPLSHAELNKATSLSPGDPATFGRSLFALRQVNPGLRVFGGCCGSNHKHTEQIGLACQAP